MLFQARTGSEADGMEVLVTALALVVLIVVLGVRYTPTQRSTFLPALDDDDEDIW
jgi:hypothetical protein